MRSLYIFWLLVVIVVSRVSTNAERAAVGLLVLSSNRGGLLVTQQ